MNKPCFGCKAKLPLSKGACALGHKVTHRRVNGFREVVAAENCARPITERQLQNIIEVTEYAGEYAAQF